MFFGVFLPSWHEQCQAVFAKKKSIFWFFTFLANHLKNTIYIGFFLAFSIFFLFFFFFLFLLLQHKKGKNKKKQFSFWKPHLWHPQNFAKNTILAQCDTICVFKNTQKHYIYIWGNSENNLDQFLTLDLDQVLTLETPNLGPVFNSTACVCIYISIYTYKPETPPGGYLFRLQDVEKQRERRKTKAKKGRKKKEEKNLETWKPPRFLGVFLGQF